jgi:hypothetical protein
LEVTDHADGKKLLVYSPAFGQLLRERAESYLSFLYTNGVCLQAFGLMHYFRAFPAMDFHYFARLLRPEKDRRPRARRSGSTRCWKSSPVMGIVV